MPVLRNLVPAQVLAGKLVQIRQLDQRGAAGLRSQPGQGDRGDHRAQMRDDPSRLLRRGVILRLLAICPLAVPRWKEASFGENSRFFGTLRLDFAVPRRCMPPTFRQAVSFACSERRPEIPLNQWSRVGLLRLPVRMPPSLEE